MKFSDIKQFTPDGNYCVNMDIEYLLEWVKEKIENLNLDIDPDFQRLHVWTESQQISFIEFVLRGGKTDPIRFNHPGWQGSYKGDFVLVDGKQRLEAIRRFVHNEIPAFNTYYSEFEDKKRVAYNTDILVRVNTLKTRAEVLQWYIEINAGGTPHTKEEIEKARKLLEKEIK